MTRDAANDMRHFYAQPMVNYRGTTADTDVPYAKRAVRKARVMI